MPSRPRSFRSFLQLFPKALTMLLQNDPLRMAGATAFFTTFALPPILVILIQALKLVLDPDRARTELFRHLSAIVGPETVRSIMNILQALRKLAQNGWITVGGFIFLLFVATTLFKVIKGSINQIWSVRPANRPGFVKSMASRAQSVAVILGAGILFILGLVTETLQTTVVRYMFELSPILSIYFNAVVNYLVSLVIVTLWLSILFRFIPDARPSWTVALAGALMTGLLFTFGKAVLRILLSYSSINNVYGTSASIVLLLLFVFYSALIVYFGAAFTRLWAEWTEDPILPRPHATRYRLIESEIES